VFFVVALSKNSIKIAFIFSVLFLINKLDNKLLLLLLLLLLLFEEKSLKSLLICEILPNDEKIFKISF
jgi:hypothetical protein